MSQRSEELLQQVAWACAFEETPSQNNAGKGYVDVAIGSYLFSEILTWLREYLAERLTPDERALLDQANAVAPQQNQTPKRYSTCLDLGCPIVKANSPEEALDMLRAALVRTADEMTVDDLWEA